MLLSETLLIAVGPAVAKTALKRWLEDEDYARDAGVAVIDMLKKKIPDLRTQKKAGRSFE